MFLEHKLNYILWPKCGVFSLPHPFLSFWSWLPFQSDFVHCATYCWHKWEEFEWRHQTKLWLFVLAKKHTQCCSKFFQFLLPLFVFFLSIFFPLLICFVLWFSLFFEPATTLSLSHFPFSYEIVVVFSPTPSLIHSLSIYIAYKTKEQISSVCGLMKNSACLFTPLPFYTSANTWSSHYSERQVKLSIIKSLWKVAKE